MKHCRSPLCEQVNPQPPENFGPSKQNRDGLKSWCKQCRRRETHSRREAKKLYDAQRYTDQREEIIERVKAAYRANPQPVKARVRRWQQDNRERHNARVRARRARQQRPRKYSAHARLIAARNASLRRARERVGGHPPFTINDLIVRDKGICQLCLLTVQLDVKWPHPLSASIDHIIPLSRGGQHHLGNAQLAHLTCNLRKGARYDRRPRAGHQLVEPPRAH